MLFRTASPADLKFVVDRAAQFEDTQGFLPFGVFDNWIHSGRIIVCEINGQPAGYLAVTGGKLEPAVVRHNTVEKELWERGYGRRWMEAIRKWAWCRTRFSTVAVRTREDIAAQNRINASLGEVIEEDVVPNRFGQVTRRWELPVTPLASAASPHPAGFAEAESGLLVPG